MNRLSLCQTIIWHRNIIIKVFIIIKENPAEIILRSKYSAGPKNSSTSKPTFNLLLSKILSPIIKTVTILILAQSTHMNKPDNILISLTSISNPTSNLDISLFMLMQKLGMFPWTNQINHNIRVLNNPVNHI